MTLNTLKFKHKKDSGFKHIKIETHYSAVTLLPLHTAVHTPTPTTSPIVGLPNAYNLMTQKLGRPDLPKIKIDQLLIFKIACRS